MSNCRLLQINKDYTIKKAPINIDTPVIVCLQQGSKSAVRGERASFSRMSDTNMAVCYCLALDSCLDSRSRTLFCLSITLANRCFQKSYVSFGLLCVVTRLMFQSIVRRSRKNSALLKFLSCRTSTVLCILERR